jgi:hypothetical protein
MISLTDSQLQTVMTTAGMLEPERRSLFLERVGAMLKLRIRGDRGVGDGDVAEVTALALHGLVHQPAA